ncbi:17161_t:CDS:2 [Entrophospora sp. SA101]|nr:6505_t:CDS:2 [Entrophospora sp. SA101]CAJ0761411.1 17161_t:CDS:2 [Entrophospora sp. SA101]CAJ0921471.1 6454_t:CDS:2 [Entrophospora sp. SA101]CAJ0921492.1 6464_t:CDS:2 [Entrophospora sp. SA101]
MIMRKEKIQEVPESIEEINKLLLLIAMNIQEMLIVKKLNNIISTKVDSKDKFLEEIEEIYNDQTTKRVFGGTFTTPINNCALLLFER